MVYEKCEKNSISVYIENIDEKDPYIAIGNKAFLSCKGICEIRLPDTIQEIGDWAFAHMKELIRITVPANGISIGKDAFLDCDNLQEIVIYPDESGNEGLPNLLASCITDFKSYNLLNFKMAVENNEEWCELYDRELFRFIQSLDEKDFKFYIVGWFDDESEEEQLKRHIEKIKTEKLKLCFLRLKYNTHCSNDMIMNLVSYIRKRFDESKEENDSSWTLFRDILSEDLKTVKVAVNYGLIDSEQRLELIKAINSRNGNTEVASYLLSINSDADELEALFEL